MRLHFFVLLVLLPVLYTISFAQEDCDTAPNPRLRAGINAQTSSGQANNLRDAPATSANRIGQIPAGSFVSILSDASCADAYYWYQVDYQGLVGWTVEGAEGDYWLIPALSSSTVISPENIAQLQIIRELTCPEGMVARPLTWSHPDASHLLWSCNSNYYITDWFTQKSSEIPIAEDIQRNSGFNNALVALYASGERYISYYATEFTIWETYTGEIIGTYSAYGDVSSTAIYGNTLAFEDMEGVHIVDLLSLTETHRWEDMDFDRHLSFSPNGQRLAFVSYDAVHIWTIETDEVLEIPLLQINDLVEDINLVQALSFSPSGRYILLALCELPNRGDCFEPVLTWVDASTGTVVSSWQEDNWDNIWDIQFGEDLVFLNVDYHLEAVQISSDERIYINEGNFNDFLVSVDGRLLISQLANRLLVYGIP